MMRSGHVGRYACHAIIFYGMDKLTHHFKLQVEDYSNQVANYFLARGYKKGDTVAFYMTNRPEYIITWYT